MTLLEQMWLHGGTMLPTQDEYSEIMHALAIAQAIDEVDNTGDYAIVLWHRNYLLKRADEILAALKERT